VSATFRVDSHPVCWTGADDARLLDVLRGPLDVTAPKPGCGIGRCGACLVLVDDAAVPSCLVLAGRLDGSEVTTSDGLGAQGDAILQALAEAGAIQCGYCASGVIVALAGALRERPRPEADAVLTALEGQLCRCGGYEGLRRAVAELFG
jgi:carbon-monoxide dehydrogenase small subunit